MARHTIPLPAWVVIWAAGLVAASLAAVTVAILVAVHLADLHCHG
jgi:hypothetical protein